jgi:hypothetical protein
METGEQMSPELSVDTVWGVAWRLYRLLFRRSFVMAAAVYFVIESVHLVRGYADAYDARQSVVLTLDVATVVVGLAGPVLVQGALIVLVRDVHEARRPETISTLLDRAGRRIGSLTWAALVYALGILAGLIALIVPGLLVFSRWSLMAPAIMLEERDAGEARARSRELVRPRTWPVFRILLSVWIATGLVSEIPWRVGAHWIDQPAILYAIIVAASAVTAPFEAHVLSVLYYRITDPERRVIDPEVRMWESVWKGA